MILNDLKSSFIAKILRVTALQNRFTLLLKWLQNIKTNQAKGYLSILIILTKLIAQKVVIILKSITESFYSTLQTPQVTSTAILLYSGARAIAAIVMAITLLPKRERSMAQARSVIIQITKNINQTTCTIQIKWTV